MIFQEIIKWIKHDIIGSKLYQKEHRRRRFLCFLYAIHKCRGLSNEPLTKDDIVFNTIDNFHSLSRDVLLKGLENVRYIKCY